MCRQRVMRQLARRQNVPRPNARLRALGFEQDNFLARRTSLKPVWGISQTPQVWLDHQFMNWGTAFNWDLSPPCFDGGWERQFRHITRCLN